MTRIALLAIDVTNCGPWRGHHRLEFPATGVAVFCAPNETGKTTLLRLVAAVLWGAGVPECNWFAREDEPFAAAIEYERAALQPRHETEPPIRYRVERDFRTGRVCLFRLEKGEWQSVQVTRHKRRGRTADSEQWMNLVQEVFAPISPRAFERLVVLSPPFNPQPEGELVQSLISGAGESTKDEALETLLERYRAITRYSKKEGLSTSDARKDGRLDELRRRRDELQRDCELAKEMLEKGLRLREEIQRLDEQVAAKEEKRNELQRNKGILDKTRRLSAERRTKEELAGNLARALDQWKKLEDSAREVREQLQRFPAFLRDSTSERRKYWAEALRKYQERARRLIEQSRVVNEEVLKERFADVWDWPADAPSRVEQIQKALALCHEAEQHHREAVSRAASIRPVLDRKRQMPVVIGVAAAVMLVLVLILGLFGYLVMGLLVGVIAAIAGGLITAQIYRPECWPPEYAQWQQKVAQAEGDHEKCVRALEKYWEEIARWAQTRELPILLERLGRFKSLCDAKRQLLNQKAELERMAAQLTVRAIPKELTDMCGLESEAADSAPLGPDVFERGLSLLNDYEKLVAQEQSYRQRQEIVLHSVGVDTIESLQERHRQAEGDLQGIILESRKLAQDSPLAEEAFSWDARRLENEYRRLEEELTRLETDLREIREQRNDRERELARWEGQNVVNLAQAQDELNMVEREITILEGRARAIATASRLIEEAYSVFSHQHRVAIQHGVNSIMSKWTGLDEREFLVDENFVVRFRVPSLGGNGNNQWKCEHLSQGAQDQLALAIRWAVLDRLAGDVVLPLLLDDCFHMWDAQRRDSLRSFLQEHRQRQIILVTHDERFLDWGEPVRRVSSEI